MKVASKREKLIVELKKAKETYEKEGIHLIGIFGSYARDEADEFSDLDILYTLDRPRFHQNHSGGFAKLVRLEEVRNELNRRLHLPIDLVPLSDRFIDRIGEHLVRL
jgi:predicted nucleotidyltransferase